MFIGEYQSSIGEKNRIGIPKKLREEIDGSLYLTRGYESCLIMVDNKRWNNFIVELNKNPLLSLGLRDTKRFILGGAVEIEYDSLGRFVIPESLKAFAGIKETLVFLGVGEWIEIWDLENWNQRLSILKNNVSDLAEKLIK